MQNVRYAPGAFRPAIGYAKLEITSIIWPVLPVRPAIVNYPPVKNLRCTKIESCARRIIWKLLMEALLHQTVIICIISRLIHYLLCSTLCLLTDVIYFPYVDGCDAEGYHKNKAKRVRTTFTEEQLQVLQANFQLDSNPDGQDLERIAQITGLSKRVTQVWFQNSRARQKKHMHTGKIKTQS